MTIAKLIKILQSAPDKNADVYIESNGSFTTEIGTSLDDNNDIQIYEEAQGDFS